MIERIQALVIENNKHMASKTTKSLNTSNNLFRKLLYYEKGYGR
jgi:hypothetical protein